MSRLTLLSYARSGVRANPLDGGPYEYLRPLYTLPTGVAYNSYTGLTEGDVYDPADQMDRAWWIANADTVVTVSASGGDYTLAQFQTALNDAASANDTRVVVVDSGASVSAGAYTLPVKTGEPSWTLVCCSDWWDGTWAPTGARYLDADTEAGHLFTVEGSSFSSPVIGTGSGGRDRYAFVGLRARRPMSASTDYTRAIVDLSTNGSWVDSIAELPSDHLFLWSWIDGVWKDGETIYQSRRGVSANGDRCVFANSIATGFGGTGADTQAILVVEGAGRLRVENALLEASSENFMSGGGTPNATFFPADITFRRTHFTKRQNWNPASSLHDGVAAQSKNLWELKHGARILLEACTLKNSWSDAQTGGGVLLKSAKQSDNEVSRTRPQKSRDITIRLCRVDDVGEVLSTSWWEFGVASPSTEALAACEPMHRIEWTGVLGVAGVRTEINDAVHAAIGMSRGGAYIPPDSDLVGGLRVRWSTFASADSGFRTRMMLMNAYQDMKASTIADCVFDYASANGLLRDGYIANADAQGLVEMGVTMSRCALPEAPASLRRTNAAWETSHPEQYEPSDLWGLCPTSPNPREAPTNWFADRATRDFSPHPSATWRGLAAGGRDPGVPFALLSAAIAGVSNAPSFIVEDFV
jgi:hypothetical protein